jgi:hypothetical protein
MSPADNLAAEIARLLAHGSRQLTLAELKGEYAALGYALDDDTRCHGTARLMSGGSEGATFPCTTIGVVEADTRQSAFHRDARRDANFRAMQALRGDAFAVVGGRILSV